jgi:CheY-like chemotaxis protein
VFHVLVIDDNPADLRLTIQAIAEAGIPCGITIATDGEAAIERLRSASDLPDLIVLDLNMPRKNGLSVIRELKHAPRTRRIPIAVVSSSSSSRDVESAYAAFANCYIVKPLTFDAYNRAIGSLSRFWFRVAQLGNRIDVDPG